MKDTTTFKKKPIQKKLSQKRLTDIRSSFDEKLKQMYWSEKQLAEILPTMAALATSYELNSALLAQLAVSENQMIRLIHIFDAIGDRVLGSTYQIIQEILDKIAIVSQSESGFERDSAIIVLAEKMTELQIVNYETLQQFASKLGEEFAAELLTMAVKEEQNVFRRMAEINLVTIYFDVAS